MTFQSGLNFNALFQFPHIFQLSVFSSIRFFASAVVRMVVWISRLISFSTLAVRFEVRGTRFKVQGSRFKVQGWGPRNFEL